MSTVHSDAKPSIKPMTRGPLQSRPKYEIKGNENVEIEKTVEKFVERQDLLISSSEYSRNGGDPGMVLIFNQEKFQNNYSSRTGTRRDVNEIVVCLSRLGFNINQEHIFHDLSGDEIEQTVEKICKMEELSRANSLIVFFLTHGESYNALHSNDRIVHAHELWTQFGKCQYLKGKPKMFILQACKGEKFSTIARNSQEVIDLVPDSTFDPDYISPDMLIVYSTTEGNVSFRDSRTGTWFIQELCKNFSSYGRRDDVVSLIMRTTKCVGRNYFHIKDGEVKKQSPIFISTLTKKFYLNRSKDRNIFLHLLKEQDVLKQRVDSLESKVKELTEDKKIQNEK